MHAQNVDGSPIEVEESRILSFATDHTSRTPRTPGFKQNARPNQASVIQQRGSASDLTLPRLKSEALPFSTVHPSR